MTELGKAKKLSSLVAGLDPGKQLGPYSGGSYKGPSGASVNLEILPFASLQPGVNEEKVCWCTLRISLTE